MEWLQNFMTYLEFQSEELIQATIEHAGLVVISIAIATVIGVGLGIATYQTDRPAKVALAVVGTMLTIPSFALFGLLTEPFGLGATAAVIALVMYALLPIVRNTVVGLRSVDPAVIESATGMGMSRRQRLARIELPLAWPIIITGVRVSTVITVGIAAIAAIINGPGLGKDIFRALARIGSPFAVYQALAPVLGVIFLGILFDVFFLLLRRLTTSRGLR
ncbi:MAG: ABC transporter permease [Actinomycetota bacterium]|nr:ABC transporter permease [Actinomycetota bacterium]